jgi:hypothetical protein
MGLFAHHPRRAGNFFHRLAFHAERGQEGGHLQRRRLTCHDLIYDIDGFLFGKIVAPDQSLDRFSNIHDRLDLYSSARGKRFGQVFLSFQSLLCFLGLVT